MRASKWVISDEARTQLSKLFTGRKLSKETIAKRKATRIAKGYDNKPRTAQPKCNYDGCLNLTSLLKSGRVWKKYCDQHAKHLSIKAKGLIGEANRGRRITKEHKQIISDANKGKSSWNKGKTVLDYSLEHRQHMSEGAFRRGSHITEIGRLKLSRLQSSRIEEGKVFTHCNIGQVCGVNYRSSCEKIYLDRLVAAAELLPTNAKKIETPIGYYTPDFEFSDRYIEVKSPLTLHLFEGSKQQQKVVWVTNNMKPVEIVLISGPTFRSSSFWSQK